MSDESFGQEELRDIARRAFMLAKRSDDPSERAALNLLGEAAANLAAKLPGASVPARPAPAGAQD